MPAGTPGPARTPPTARAAPPRDQQATAHQVGEHPRGGRGIDVEQGAHDPTVDAPGLPDDLHHLAVLDLTDRLLHDGRHRRRVVVRRLRSISITSSVSGSPSRPPGRVAAKRVTEELGAPPFRVTVTRNTSELQTGGWWPNLSISAYIRSTPTPALSARVSARTALVREAFLDLELTVRMFSGATPRTNDPGDVTARRAAPGRADVEPRRGGAARVSPWSCKTLGVQGNARLAGNSSATRLQDRPATARAAPPRRSPAAGR